MTSSASPLTTQLETVRIAVLPYLPPPVIKLISKADEELYSLFDIEEASFKILFAFITLYVVLTVVSSMIKFFTYSKSGDELISEEVLGSVSSALSRGKLVVLCGGVNSGKTVLFHRLTNQKMSEYGSVMSIIASEDYNEDSDVTLLDYPGHEKLRAGLMTNTVLGRAHKIVFVVDSASSPSALADSASILFEIFMLILNKRCKTCKIVICCTKSDLKRSKNLKRIQLSLKTELNRLRTTRATMLSTDTTGSSSPGSNTTNALLGRPNVPFDWDFDVPCEVSFISTSLLCTDGSSSSSEGLNEISDFIYDNY